MANKPIDMNKLRATLRLFTEGKSKVFISQYLEISRNTAKRYIRKFEAYKLTYDQVQELSDQ